MAGMKKVHKSHRRKRPSATYIKRRSQEGRDMRELVIGQNEAGQRFDKYLKKLLSQAPGSFIYKMLRKKNFVYVSSDKYNFTVSFTFNSVSYTHLIS